MSLGLVLGGGGIAGVAWEIGVIAGLAEAGVRLDSARRVVGTSAGSIVGVALASGADVASMLTQQREAEPPSRPHEPAPSILDDSLAWAEILSAPGSRDELMRRMGAMAAESQTVPEDRYRDSIAAMLPADRWPADVEMRITGVDAETGAVQVWDAESGVALAAAVAASCAVPGQFPLVTIEERRYFDGGMASPTHADLAAGCTEVLAIAPFSVAMAGPDLDAEIAGLGSGVRSAVIVPDQESITSFGNDPMDPATRRPAAEAGRAQGRAEAMRIGIILSL